MKLVTICRECAMKPDEVILFALPRYVNIVTQWCKKKRTSGVRTVNDIHHTFIQKTFSNLQSTKS